MDNNILSRPIYLHITNRTKSLLKFVNIRTFSGTEAQAVPLIINQNQTSIVKAEERLLREPVGGPSGIFAWESTDSNLNCKFTYNHPISSAKTTVDTTISPPDYQIITIKKNLNQHNAEAYYEIVSSPSENITINIKNCSETQLYFVLFQIPEGKNNDIFNTTFPVTWKVFPLSENQITNIIYPLSIQIAVKDYVQNYDANMTATIQDTEVGVMWEYIQEGDFSKLKKTDQKTTDGLLGCWNKTSKLIDVCLAKGGKILVIKRQVGQQRKAELKLTPKLYFLAVSDLTEMDLIKSQEIIDKSHLVDITNLKSIDVILYNANSDTKSLAWKDENKVFAS